MDVKKQVKKFCFVINEFGDFSEYDWIFFESF